MNAFEKIKERLEAKKDNLVNNHKLFTDIGKGRLVLVCEAEIEAFTNAISVVSEVEAEYGNGWIDVKDRLPEKDGYYLTCDHKGNIHVFYHHPSYVTNGSNMAFGIRKNHPQFYQPIAWMELPKPYNRLERK